MIISEITIKRYLDMQGVKHSNLGYQYLVSGMLITANNSGISRNIADLYIQIADMYGTKPLRVERAIRHLIRNSNQTNKEFILRAVDDIKCNINISEKRERQEHVGALEIMIKLLQCKDEYTYKHSERVAKFMVMFGKELEFSEKEIKELKLAGLFHDIGKIAISEEILKKKRKLTIEEYAKIKKHPEIGYEILKTISGVENILPTVLYHHERYDGSGYPAELKGEEIPMKARMLSIVDAFDVMTSNREYKSKMSIMQSIDQFEINSNNQFDPILVKTFCTMMKTNRECFSKILLF